MSPTKSVEKQPSVIFFFNVIGFQYLLLHHHSVVYHIRHIRLDDGFQFAFHLALTRRFPHKIVLHHHIVLVVIKPCHTLTIKEQHIIALHKKASGEENIPFRSFICFIRIVYFFQRHALQHKPTIIFFVCEWLRSNASHKVSANQVCFSIVQINFIDTLLFNLQR